ncbi:MAG: hypothetical protein ACPF9D_04210, partial [Owenweeksia sp.]
VTFNLVKPVIDKAKGPVSDGAHNLTPLGFESHAYRMKFVNSNPFPNHSQTKQKKEYLNYFRGNDPAKWKSHVGIFGEITYQE